MTTRYMNGNGAHPAATEPTPPPKRQRQRAPRAIAVPTPQQVQPWWDFSKKQLVGWASAGLLTLIGAGWLALPAKQSEVVALGKDMKAGFDRIDAGFVAIGEKFRALDLKMDSLRSDLVRVQTIQEIEAGAPASPPTGRVRKVIRKESVKAPPPEIKANSLFGF